MAKVTPIEAMQWAQFAMQLVTIGATSVAAIKQATADAGWAEDDARLAALDQLYAERIERAKKAAAGGV
jgi:hypothetical protein